jgi:hypothetical protein
MTWLEFKAALKLLGLTQRDFTRLIGSQTPTAVNKWREKPAVPDYAKVIVRLALAMKQQNAEWATAEIGALVPERDVEKPEAGIDALPVILRLVLAMIRHDATWAATQINALSPESMRLAMKSTSRGRSKVSATAEDERTRTQ